MSEGTEEPAVFDQEAAERAIRDLLAALGENVEREGLEDTPRRVAAMFAALTGGLRADPPKVTTFSEGIEYDQIVLIANVPFWSLCEHHLAPFKGVAHIAYLPGKQKVGLSKPARILDHFAARPQVQERLGSQIANFLLEHEDLTPKGVMVVLAAEHLCMSMRGVKKHESYTVTTAIRGEIDKLEVYQMLQIPRPT